MWFNRKIRIFSGALALVAFVMLVGHEHVCHPDDSGGKTSGACWICKTSVDFDQPHIAQTTTLPSPEHFETVIQFESTYQSSVYHTFGSRAPPQFSIV